MMWHSFVANDIVSRFTCGMGGVSYPVTILVKQASFVANDIVSRFTCARGSDSPKTEGGLMGFTAQTAMMPPRR
jgi:hypothetical protein